MIYCEWSAHFWIKGVEEKVVVPRSMVFILGKAEGVEEYEGEVGFEELQIKDVKLYYDRSMLVPYLRRSEQEKQKFGT